MIYFCVPNHITQRLEFYALEQEANAAFETNKLAYLEQEAYRFSIAKVVVEGNNTTWMNADFQHDSDEGAYQVFNTFTGQHEEYSSLAAAILRREEIKSKFALSVFGQAPTQVDEKDVPHMQSPHSIPVTEV